MTWLLIKDGIIENHIVITDEDAAIYIPPDGMELVHTDEWFNIGWGWNGVRPVEPLIVEPEVE